MERLTLREEQSVMGCIREIYSDLNYETIPVHILSAISKIIPASQYTYDEINPSKQKFIHRGFPKNADPKMLPLFQAYMHEHPVINLVFPDVCKPHPFLAQIKKSACRRHMPVRSVEGMVVRISDLLTNHRFHRLGLYNEFYRPQNINYQILLTVLHRPPHGVGITLNRDGVDFTEKERLILNLLSPHILQAFQNAEACYKMATGNNAAPQYVKIGIEKPDTQIGWNGVNNGAIISEQNALRANLNR
jgi:hypothetical protein